MLSIIFIGLVIVVLCVFPVMITARKLNTGKSDLIDCILAIIVGTFISSIVVGILPGGDSSVPLATGYWLLATGFVYKIMLEATLVAGLIIAIVPAIFNFILVKIFE
ncbi:MAG: hypothetical protein JKY50_08970 [Oleispira sp.]|nr:hypothetical protein [Oleispira sp.]